MNNWSITAESLLRIALAELQTNARKYRTLVMLKFKKLFACYKSIKTKLRKYMRLGFLTIQ
jgi:hypothetical protein